MILSGNYITPRIESIQRICEMDLLVTAPLWDGTERGRLIESILLRLPIGIIIVDEGCGLRRMVDGNERIGAIVDFYNNKLSLHSPEFNSMQELAEKHYGEIPRHLQRRFLEYDISVYTIDRNTPYDERRCLHRRFTTSYRALFSELNSPISG